jgi:hypothetical protein
MLLYIDAEFDKKRRKYNNSNTRAGQEQGGKINKNQINKRNLPA